MDAPKVEFADIVEPVKVAWRRRSASRQISSLAAVRAANDFVSEQFQQRFLKEQVEEIAT